MKKIIFLVWVGSFNAMELMEYVTDTTFYHQRKVPMNSQEIKKELQNLKKKVQQFDFENDTTVEDAKNIFVKELNQIIKKIE